MLKNIIKIRFDYNSIETDSNHFLVFSIRSNIF